MYLNVGAFRPTLSRDQMFPRPSHWQHLRDRFKAETGLDVTDAAHVMQQGSTFFSNEERKEADRRFRAVVQEDYPQVQHGDLPHDLMEGEEMVLDC